jgi:Zn-dependent protease
VSGGPLGEGEGGGFSFQLLGFPVRVHPSAFAILGLLVLLRIESGPAAIVDGVKFWIILLGSVLVHELGHALAARRLDMGPCDITLHGFGGYTRARPRGPKKGILMTAAGPAAGLALGAAALALYLSGAVPPGPLLSTVAETAEINLFWSVFNLLPMLPMDGGLILLQALTLWLGAERAERGARAASVVTAVLMAAGAFYTHWYILGFFALYALSRAIKR